MKIEARDYKLFDFIKIPFAISPEMASLVEQGTHKELMASEGEYTRLYKSQEQWYLA